MSGWHNAYVDAAVYGVDIFQQIQRLHPRADGIRLHRATRKFVEDIALTELYMGRGLPSIRGHERAIDWYMGEDFNRLFR